MFNIILILVVVIIVYFIFVYNKLVQSRNWLKNSYQQIDVQLKRRYDLIPNLVETARAVMKHEKDTLETVIRARNTAQSLAQFVAQNPTNISQMKQMSVAESLLSDSLSKLLVTVEAYPELKANQNMAQLTEELVSTENKISYARQAFNDSVMSYNNLCEVFPQFLIARAFGFQAASGFEILNTNEKQNIQVQF